MIQLADNGMGGASAVVYEGRINGFPYRLVLTRIRGGAGSAFYSIEQRSHNALGQSQRVPGSLEPEDERKFLANALSHLVTGGVA